MLDSKTAKLIFLSLGLPATGSGEGNLEGVGGELRGSGRGT